MSRMVTRSVQRENYMSVRLSEVVVMAIVVLAGVGAVRSYLQFRQGPTYALESFLHAVKVGDPAAQYDLIDDSDKHAYAPTERDYAKKVPLANGYTERIVGEQLSQPKINSATPQIAHIDASISVRGSGAGEALYQTSSTSNTSQFALHKGSDGHWRVVLSQSKLSLPPPDKPSQY